jgi:hypothetical protein
VARGLGEWHTDCGNAAMSGTMSVQVWRIDPGFGKRLQL